MPRTVRKDHDLKPGKPEKPVNLSARAAVPDSPQELPEYGSRREEQNRRRGGEQADSVRPVERHARCRGQ